MVRRGYDAIGPRYRDWSHLSPVRLRWVDRLLEQLLADSVVVELGCGPGEPATRLLSQRHNVLAVDASAVQLRLARESAPRAQLVHADLTHFSMQSGSVDAVASFYALGHVPAKDHPPLFSRIFEWLRPGGLLVTNAPVAGDDDHVVDWLDVPMFFGGIGEAATSAALSEAGFSIEDWQIVPEDEGGGHSVSFLWLLARKNG